MRVDDFSLGAPACPTDDLPALPEATLQALVANPVKNPRKPRTRRSRADRVADHVIGCKLPSADHARLMVLLAQTGERPSTFARRAILAALSSTDHA